MSETGTTPVIDAIGVVCADLPRSITFYRALGCDLPEADETGHVACDLAGGARLMLDTDEVMRSFGSVVPEGRPGGGRITLAVRCASPAEVDRLHDELLPLGRGSHLVPFDAFWGQRYATVLDPDGSRIDLYCDLPGAPG